MSVQTTYNFGTTIGEAGGILDMAPYAVDSFTNEAETGDMKFGVGVVKGTAAGKQVKLPTSASEAADFEGIVTNRRTAEYDMEGHVHIAKNSTLGVMRYGNILARVATGVTPAYGDAVYMLKTGTEAGYFTNASSGNLAIKGRFIGTVDAINRVAAVALFNGSAPSAN